MGPTPWWLSMLKEIAGGDFDIDVIEYTSGGDWADDSEDDLWEDSDDEP